MNSYYNTERLVLRRFEKNDIDEYYSMLSDASVYCWLGNRQKKSFEDAVKIMEYFNNVFEKNAFGVYAVIEKDSGNFIGQAGFNTLSSLDCIEYLYAFKKDSWGKGYATEAGKELIKNYVIETGQSSLIALTHKENVQSKRVLNKLGFIEKGEKERFGSVLNYYEMK